MVSQRGVTFSMTATRLWDQASTTWMTRRGSSSSPYKSCRMRVSALGSPLVTHEKIKLKGDGMDACQWIHRGDTALNPELRMISLDTTNQYEVWGLTLMAAPSLPKPILTWSKEVIEHDRRLASKDFGGGHWARAPRRRPRANSTAPSPGSFESRPALTLCAHPSW